MNKDELFTFVSEFNALNTISLNTVLEGLNKLPAKDHELFMLLVNYKKGEDFAKKLKSGEV